MAQGLAAETALVPNNGGGLSFAVDDFARLRRFLVLGADGGSYYVRAPKLAFDNATAVIRLLNDGQGFEVVKSIVEISTEGRAAKQGPALFALALCSRFGDAQVRAAALASLPYVCRTASTLMQFLKLHGDLGSSTTGTTRAWATATASDSALRSAGKVSWGRAMRREVGNWYLSKDPMALAYQITKYVQREGWSHRDLLRLAHPNPAKQLKRKTSPVLIEDMPQADLMEEDPVEAAETQMQKRRKTAGEYEALFKFITKQGNIPPATDLSDPTAPADRLLGYLAAANSLRKGKQAAQDPAAWEKEACDLIQRYRFTWEHVGDTSLLKSPAIWTVLLQNSLPMGALLRNLARMTAIGVFTDSSNVDKACSRFTDEAALRSARLHPLVILEAMRTYASGKGEKGSLTWQPHPSILAALDTAFYLAFRTVQPAGKRFMVALDVSGSMTCGNCVGMRLKPFEAGAALTMALLHSEPSVITVAFSHHLIPLPFALDDTLDQAMAKASAICMGGTDCSAPMVHAQQQGLAVDVFVVITDCETNCNSVPPHRALQQYRAASGIHDAKLVVMAMTATEFSIADPHDRGMLDVAGLDSAVPQLLTEFALNKL